jgi:hypothetical protein
MITPYSSGLNREAQLRVDSFALENPERFGTVLGKLILLVGNESRAKVATRIVKAQVVKGFRLYVQAIRAGTAGSWSPLNHMFPVFWGPILITYFHLRFGSPLFLNYDLMLRWNTDETVQAGQCEVCGYCLPMRIVRCSLCGGSIVDIGAWRPAS